MGPVPQLSPCQRAVGERHEVRVLRGVHLLHARLLDGHRHGPRSSLHHTQHRMPHLTFLFIFLIMSVKLRPLCYNALIPL